MGATHRVTVSHYAETGATVGDGAGGTTAVREWETVYTGPARFSDGTDAVEGTETDVAGPVEIDTPSVRFDPKAVGTLTWVTTADGDRYPEYDCDIGYGDAWRVTVHGHGDGDPFAIDDVREPAGAGPVPTRVVAVLEHNA